MKISDSFCSLILGRTLICATVCACVVVLTTHGICADRPSILSLDRGGHLEWTSDFTNGVAIFEGSTNLQPGSWSPVSYDIASGHTPLLATLWSGTEYYVTNYNQTNEVRTTKLPASASTTAFYRVAIQTNPPDPSLVIHLSFDNDLSNGYIVDISGHNNHALQYSATNWPSKGTGPDGSQAGLFGGPRPVPPPFDPDYTQGDYAGIPYSPSFDHLAKGTVLAWAYYDSKSYHNSTIVDASAYGTEANSWYLGRTYSPNTLFEVFDAFGGARTIEFPDPAPAAGGAGATGAWHYYGVTWNGTNIIGFFDGLPFATNSQAGFPELAVGRMQWMAIGCKVHDGNPQWGDSDGLPNWGWFGGSIDDVRIYNRALGFEEILSLYRSFDKQPPSAVPSVRVKVDSSTQAEVRWEAAADDFRVDGYRVLRNGTAIATNPAPGCYVDTGLSPNTIYTYAIQAFDPAGNLSVSNVPVTITTPLAGSPVEVIVDNADGPQWVTVAGGPWNLSGGPASGFDDRWEKDVLLGGDTTSGSVTFRPNLPEPGNYSVYLWHPYNGYWYLFDSAAPVDVVHDGTMNTVYVNEQTNYGTWDLLGTFTFGSGTNSFVRIRVSPGTPITPADAVKFVK